MMCETVNHDRRHLVIGEETAPLREFEVRGQNEAPGFVAVGDDPKQQLRAVSVHGDIAPLVENEPGRPLPGWLEPFEGIHPAGCAEAEHPVGHREAADRIARLARPDPHGRRAGGVPAADGAEEHPMPAVVRQARTPLRLPGSQLRFEDGHQEDCRAGPRLFTERLAGHAQFLRDDAGRLRLPRHPRHRSRVNLRIIRLSGHPTSPRSVDGRRPLRVVPNSNLTPPRSGRRQREPVHGGVVLCIGPLAARVLSLREVWDV